MLVRAMTSYGQEAHASREESCHVPVMLEDVLEALQPRPGGVYIDGTFGGGGHTLRLANLIGANGAILAFDRDPEAAARAHEIADAVEARIDFVSARFSGMSATARERGFETVDGVLLDLGLSSFQLSDAERGFSFLREGPLDMRMGKTSGESASDLIAHLSEAELTSILFDFGEERQARRIVRAIVRERAYRPIETTTQLAELVVKTIGRPPGARIHPATRTFQALRIAVNDELEELRRGLEAAADLLTPGGRLVVISFHSLEDRIVKQFIAREVNGCICPPDQPVCTCGRTPRLRSIGKARRPADAEVERNPRSRSAIMRVAERLP
jgi:16S rRNA (cytosine1402-N4)-methyltransferase